jgi:hypothetical protein
MDDDDWFMDAAKEAAKLYNDAPRTTWGSGERVAEIKAKMLAEVVDTKLTVDAAKLFKGVASGTIGTSAGITKYGGSGGIIPGIPETNYNAARTIIPRPGSTPTPEQGLDAIVKAVKSAGDADAVLRVGGEWITKITNQITEAIREEAEE